MNPRTRNDWILWAQAGCALVATAHAEYVLATSVNLHWIVAGAVPGALDLYVIRALQKRKDVLPAVLVMVAANVASILVQAGVIPLHWGLYSAVGALAPLLLWRGHVLRVLEQEGTGAVSAPEPPALAPAPETYSPQVNDSPWAAGFHLDGCDGQHQHQGPVNCMLRASALQDSTEYPAPDWLAMAKERWVQMGFGAPDRVPDWMADEYPTSTPDDTTSAHPPKASAVPYLAPVPDLPPEYADTAVHEETSAPILYGTDWEHLPGAEAYVEATDKPTVKGLRRELGIGQDRAERLLSHLGVRP